MSDIDITLTALANGEDTTATQRTAVIEYLTHLNEQEQGAPDVRRPSSRRFPRVGGAQVFAHFYDRSNSRFVILAFRDGSADPWVVAHIRNLADSEWETGRYLASYDDAVTVWLEKVMTATARNVRPV
jgi:hypothetical protein